MKKHPSAIVVEIQGIEESSHGRSCEHHGVCGSVLNLDIVLRLRAVQIEINNKEESAIAAYWVTEGVDRCRVGFLPRDCVLHKDTFDGKLCQVTEIFSASSSNSSVRHEVQENKGVCYADIIHDVTDEEEKNMEASRSPFQKEA